jgi:hypothetical protein
MKDPDFVLDQHDTQPTKETLQTNGNDDRDAEDLDPTTRLDQPERNRQDHRHQANPGRNQPVRVLVKDASNPPGDRKKEHIISKTVRPIRDRHSGAV